ncbi:hypothetical protein Bbelb_083770 [Branchiostoma belcheri]|nr:hypothetical protein Bbelb_083770 [Branchiostoma belcheri]
MNMQESQTDWTHIADKAATTPNPLYVSGSDVSGDADKTKCCNIRKKLWITIDIVFGVAIVVILAYCAAKGLLGSTGESLGMGGQTGLPGSTGSPEGNGSVGMGGQTGLPGSTGSHEANGPVGKGGQAGLPGSTGSHEANGPVGMDGQTGLPGSAGSKGHMALSCGIQWVMMAMGDEAGITWSIGSREEKVHVGMGGQAGVTETLKQRDGNKGMAGAAAVAASGPQEPNGPESSLRRIDQLPPNEELPSWSASSKFDHLSHHSSSADRADINTRETADAAGAWIAATNDQDQWLMRDLGDVSVITGVITKGRNYSPDWPWGIHDQYVTSYIISYGNENGDETFYTDAEGQVTVFPANDDRDTEVYNDFGDFSGRITARFVKIHPQTWHGYISMRAKIAHENTGSYFYHALYQHIWSQRQTDSDRWSYNAAQLTLGSPPGVSLLIRNKGGAANCATACYQPSAPFAAMNLSPSHFLVNRFEFATNPTPVGEILHVVILHAAEDEEFVRRLVEGLTGLPRVTGAPGAVSCPQLTSTLTLGSVKLVVPVISRHLLADQSSLTVGLETAVRNNKPRYVIWLDQNQDDFHEFGTLVSRQYPTLEAPARRVQRDRVGETMPGGGVSWMSGIAFDVRDALCRQTGELRVSCWYALYITHDFLSDNMNLPAVLTRLEQENQLSPADVRSIQAEQTPVSRAGRLLYMLYNRRRQEPYDWLVRVLQEEGQDFLVEEMQDQDRDWERYFGTGEQQTAQPGHHTAQTEHWEHSLDKSQAAMQIQIHHPDAYMGNAKTPFEVKSVFLGQTEAGKTSLLNCMMKGQGHGETKTDRTIGVDVISFHDTKNNVKYAMYDFGGHQIYHYTHRFFLTRQALHILNVDLPAYKSEEFQERVGTWLTSVTSHVFNPAILVVGTKVDMFPPDKAEEMIEAACSSIQRDIQGAESKIQTKLKEDIGLCQKALDSVDSESDMPEPFYGLTMDDVLAKKESLEKLLDGRPKGLLNVQVIPVSSKTFQGIEALCNKMTEMVKNERLFPAARQELPTSWTKLSGKIKTSERTSLKVRDCRDIGAAVGMKESDVLNALSYLHVTGQILFYNHIRGMEDLVFPDPTIILTLFKQIFRHDRPGYLDSIAESLPEHTRAQFAKDGASFSKTGRASDSFMKNLLGDNIVTFNRSVTFPTQLPAAQPDEVAHCWPEVVPSGGEEISVTIEYNQEPPLGLPETMVSRLLSMEQTTRRLLTKDTVVVHVEENSADIMLRHSVTREEIRIRGEPEKAWRRAQTVMREIEDCWDEFPALYSSNSVGSGTTAKSLTIEAVKRHLPGDLLRLSRGIWKGPVPDTRTPADVIGKYFIDNRLYQVSRAVGEERQLWNRLGQELGLNRSVLDNISGMGDTQGTFQMLKAWRTKTPHGPLHYLPQLEETLQKIGKPDLAKDVQGIYKEYRDALPTQEVSPEMTGDTDWSLRLPGEGKYLCGRTGLGVVTPYPLHVTYRSANWSDNWQEDQGWMPVGPLFSIQCEDVEGSVDIQLPHVLHLDQNTALNPDDIAIVHVVGETEELLTVSDITPTHLTTRFRKGSKFGPVVRKVLGMDLSRNGLCVVFAPPNFPSVFQLHVYIISNVVVMVEHLQNLEGKVGYSSWDPEQCVLKLGEEYRLEVTAKNGADVEVETRPEEGLEFDDTFETGKYYKKFRVEVDARKYSRVQRSKLRFDLHLKNADQTVCRFIPTKGTQAVEGAAAADDSDSGVSESDGADANTQKSAVDSGKRAQGAVQRAAGHRLPVTIKTLGPTSATVVVLLVSDEYCTSKGGISTINLDIARKLTAAGALVYVTVLTASEEDIRDAERDGVILLKPRLDPSSSAKPSLEWLKMYHSVHFPDLPSTISCIVGHVPITSTAARRIKEERFQHAKLAMFGHVMPEETEPYKSDEKALGVGRKEASIQDDIGKANVVFSVGARIYRHYARFLRQRHVDHHIFLPEPSKVFSDTNVIFGEDGDGQKEERVILSIGRVRNVERLKGHDLAAGGVDKAAQRLDSQFTLRLRVRGIDENDFKESKRILDEKLRSGRVKPTLLPYGTQEEIRRDMENCHLVLMPSRAEPFGLVGLEAIAAGVPVLISEQSGLAELVTQLSKKYQPNFRHCIVKMKGDTATDADAEKWADCIEDSLRNARFVFEEARAFKEKLLASKYWEESNHQFLHACGISGKKLQLLQKILWMQV